MQTSNRFVLCRPHGGLNDMLCQVERCCQYAERFGRSVVIDTDHHNLKQFRDKLSQYFVAAQPDLMLDYDLAKDQLKTLQAFPESVSQRLDDYPTQVMKLRRGWRIKGIITDETGTPLTFDFHRDYPQPLLVHQQYGGGDIAVGFFTRVTLCSELQQLLLQRIEQIGQPYRALHIRHTDYQTNYRQQLQQLPKDTDKPYLVATDSAQALAACQAYFGKAKVFNFTSQLSQSGEAIHLNPSYQANVDAILDLLLLAFAGHLQPFEIDLNLSRRGGALSRVRIVVRKRLLGRRKYSGFARLANNLKQHQDILTGLLDPEIHHRIIAITQ